MRRQGSTWTAGLAVAACLVSLPAAAQEGPTGTAYEPASFQDVLKNPDDVDVNLRYARTQIDKGNLNAAASTLSRILMTNPQLDRVRLLYAIVLFRMDDLTQARREFASLRESGELNERRQSLVARYLERIRRAQADFTGSARIGAGVYYDSNRNAHPDADSFRVLNRVVPATQDENDDVGYTGFGRVQLAHDPGLQRVENVRLTVQGRMNEQVQEDQLDLVTGAITGDTTIHLPSMNVTPAVGFRHYTLGGDSFAHIPSADVTFSHRFKTNTDLRAHTRLGVRYEDFENSSRLPFNDEQSGPLYEVEVGLGYRISPVFEVAGAYTFRRKAAEEAFHSFVGHRFSADGTYIFPNQTHLSAHAEVELDDYRARDPFISTNTTRHDTDSRVRLRYGVPVDMLRRKLGGDAAEPLTRDLVVSLSGSYINESSNIRNFDYENWRTMLTISKGFSF